MRHWIYSLSIILVSLTSCSSQKKLVTEAPFSVNGPSCQTWVGGSADSGSGITLTLPVGIGTSADLAFTEVFFRGQVTEASFEKTNDKTIATCKYDKTSTEKIEMPFELKQDEAVIGYTENGSKKTKYTKISGVKEKQPLIYPSQPKN